MRESHTSLTSFGKLTHFFLFFLLGAKLTFMMLFAGGVCNFIKAAAVAVEIGMVLAGCCIAACSSFDLKQFEHKSFFQAFCTNR